ncbi:helix-turn-helix domain-containing protein [Pseudoalteromonas rhizosphaerae]|uniref:helix-turn-helix domain-containing protein n=1 Tax=Pseudoalteromonas rhizosphaerae TaxID=2518973 RepID=UPI001230B365|nr:helix-turn-helix domain-containing protein [Pseudoalteromonas rhizosphaerae]
MFKKLKKQLTDEQKHVNQVFERLCYVYGVQNNAALERELGLSNAYCTGRIKRGSLPFELIYNAAIEKQTSYEQILFGAPMKQVDGNDLLIIKQGILKSLLKIKAGDLMAKANTPHDLESIAKIQAESVESELTVHWAKQQKDSA